MKKLLILGGGSGQMAAVRRAKQLNHYTIIADYLPHPPAAAVADLHVQVSSFDVQGCLRAARELGVDGVLTMATDQPLYTAAVIAGELGLPFPFSADTAYNATNKQAMKQVFTRHGLPHPRHAYLKSGEDAAAVLQRSALPPPYVLKPLDSQGQRGVFKLPDAAAVAGKLPDCLACSRLDTALAEEYYPHEEITVNGWVKAGRLHILAVTDRLTIDAPPSLGVCYGHRFPSRHMRRYGEIKELSEAITAALGVTDGPAYYQLLLGARGLLINEVALRLGGAYEHVMIPRVSGFSTVDAILAQALGEPPPTDALECFDAAQASYAGIVQLMFCAAGRVAEITPLPELMSLPGVLAAGYHFSAGDIIPTITDASARFGYCVMLGQEWEREQLNQRFWQTFHVRDENGLELAQPRFI